MHICSLISTESGYRMATKVSLVIPHPVKHLLLLLLPHTHTHVPQGLFFFFSIRAMCLRLCGTEGRRSLDR